MCDIAIFDTHQNCSGDVKLCYWGIYKGCENISPIEKQDFERVGFL